MSNRRRPPTGMGFGANGGSDIATYVTRSEDARQVHRHAEREVEAGERLARVRIDRIDRSPYQVRVNFDGEDLEALARDMKENGLNQPVTIRAKPDGRYELVAGERRWLAARAAGMETVDARIRELDDFESHLVGVSENNQRADLSPWEKAVETLRLRDHAAGVDRPHSQRDLARYLNRNVAIVNQQLAIASTITESLTARANIATRDVCALAHETLHRIARLEPERRAPALEDAVRVQRERKTTGRTGRSPLPLPPTEEASAKPAPAPKIAGVANAEDTPADEREEPDRWTQLWENGGFRISIRKPLRDVEPIRAQKYIQDLLPGLGGLAVRAADEDSALPVFEWEHAQGRLLFLRTSGHLAPEACAAARGVLGRILAELEATR